MSHRSSGNARLLKELQSLAPWQWDRKARGTAG